MENCTGSRCKYCDRQCSKRCGRCQQVYYCTLICQKLDWPSHKTGCLRGSTDKMDSKEEEVCQKLNNENQSHFSPDQDTRPNSNKDKTGGNNPCAFCSLFGCTKKCSRCKEAFYCSIACQKQDWNQHKSMCKKALTEEDERILKCWRRKKEHVASQKEFAYQLPLYQNFKGHDDRFFRMLTRKQALLRSTPPKGSLIKAIQMTKRYFPEFKVLSAFAEIPQEHVNRLTNLMGVWNDQYVLVAFMYRYHEHAMRHGVYLKDDKDIESKVEFYLDEFGDNPSPYFSYSQVKPGGYICLKSPVMHRFVDGTIGIRIDRPQQVRVLPIDDVMSITDES